jgi:hypothetical protein
VNAQNEKLQARLERLAEELVDTLYTFLCKSVLAMEPDDVRRRKGWKKSFARQSQELRRGE